MSANFPPDLSLAIPAAPSAAPVVDDGETTPIVAKRIKDMSNKIRIPNNDERKGDMVKEIIDHIVGLMPVQEFLEEFLPPNATVMPPDLASRENLFPQLKEKKQETHLYDPWIAILSDFCQPHLTQVNTGVAQGPNLEGNHMKPDITVYRTNAQAPGCDPFKAELFIEFKFDPDDDPFADHADGFNHISQKANETLGQITGYATAHQAAQFRTHVFFILAFPTFIRLSRWDRSGVVVTERIQLSDPMPVYEFMWRLGHADKAVRGIDESIEVPNLTPVEATRIRDALDNTTTPLAQITIGGKRYIFLAHPSDPTASPIGRSTRRFLAYSLDAEEPGLVFLKDTWRVLDDDQLPEHEIYEKLRNRGVRNIAECVVGQDVAESLAPSNPSYHDTKTGKYIGRAWNKGRRQPLRTFRHYRLILEHIQFTVAQFRNVRELVTVVRDAFIACDDAFIKAHIMHRDISIGNIMFKEEGGKIIGILIDWDLCKDLSLNPSSKRLCERTGTWAFMSARLAQGGSGHRRQDDAESFYQVLSYLASYYLEHSISIIDLVLYINESFIQRVEGRSSRSRSHHIISQFPGSCMANERLNSILMHLSEIIAVQYKPRVRGESSLSRRLAEENHRIMASDYWLSDILTDELEEPGWEEFGGRVDRESELRARLQTSVSSLPMKRSSTSTNRSRKSSRKSTSHTHASQSNTADDITHQEEAEDYEEEDNEDADQDQDADTTLKLSLPAQP